MTGVLWRGTTVSTDMVDPLNELARLSGSDIYVSPIKGYGSYVTNKASAGIDTGGGHLDINLVGLNSEQKLRLERIARMIGFYADIREPTWWSPIRKIWLKGSWQSHLHMVKKDTPDRSIPARAQLAEWYAGSNGLAGFDWNGKYMHDPDDGPRQYLNQTWTQYKQKVNAMTLGIEDAKAILRADIVPSPTDTPEKRDYWQADTYLKNTYLQARSANQNTALILTAVAKLNPDVDEAALAREFFALMEQPLRDAVANALEGSDGASPDEIAKATVDLLTSRMSE